jgi:hypothetical protein
MTERRGNFRRPVRSVQFRSVTESKKKYDQADRKKKTNGDEEENLGFSRCTERDFETMQLSFGRIELMELHSEWAVFGRSTDEKFFGWPFCE